MLSEGNTAHFIWIVSSFLPFIALAGFTEIARSTSYNMAELEMSCKYSLSHVLLARLGILGLTEAILFAVIIAAFWHAGAADVISSFGAGIAGLGSFGTDAVGMSDADIINNFGAGLAGTSDADAAGGFGAAGSASAMNLLRLGAYLFVPFLLTCALSLLVLDILRSRESLYICGGIACFVCIGNALLSNHHVYFETIFADDYVPFWNIAFIVLLLCTVWGLVKLIRRTEETQWNWSLTA